MKISNKYNEYTSAYKHRKQNGGVFNRYNQQPIYFQTNPLKVISDKKITYNNIDNIVKAVDDILGKDGYLSSQIKKAGLKNTGGELVIKQKTFLDALISTCKYPICDMPFEIINSIGKRIQKTPFKEIGEKILNNELIQTKIGNIEAKKSEELVCKILEQFCENEKLFGGDLNKLTAYFKQASTDKITKTAKAYASRDERTLNRLVTGGIGAILSAKDMYNISMLEKDDKKSAKDAEKSRRNQEMTRVGLSAGLTFLTLGVFDKYTKGNYILTSFIIAGSTLFSEIISRITKHKALLPLSPQKAKKLAQQQTDKKLEENNISYTKIALDKAGKNDKANLFKDFTNIENKPETTNKIENINENNKTKSTSLAIKLATTMALSSIIYLISHKLKGEYAQKIAKKALLDSDGQKIQEFINTGDISVLSSELLEKINNVSNNKTSKFEAFKDKITNRTVDINLSHIEEQIDNLLSSPDSKEITPIIEFYKEQAEFLKQKNYTIYSQKVPRTVISALYEGTTKIFKTLYTIFSAPAKLLTYISEKSFKESEKTFKDLNKLLDSQDENRMVEKYKKQLSELNNMFKKYENKDNGYKKITKLINAHTRNFEKGAETSELANFSRTLVTLISSYFYVNDFRNTVLIESEGENTQRAKEVMNDSISFKLCNFFFNGTLMNLFNSLFKHTLNGSLTGATLIAAATEITNEFLIRQTIARPMRRLNSRDEIIEYEGSKANRKGFAGWWTRNFKKLTGQKSLVEKYENSKSK